jgi:hypothetical protein
MTEEVEMAKAAVEVAKDAGPFAPKNLIPTLWMLAISMMGGAVNFYQKVKSGKARVINVTELIGEMVTSAFVGIVCFWICKSYGVNEYATAAGVAISGHMGARAIFLAEQWIEERAKKL